VTVRTLRGFLALAAALSSADLSAAAEPLPGGLPDVVGPRALALSAATGIASGNEGLFLNPAAAAARRRYSIEGLVFVDRRGAETAAQVYGVSVVDSITSPVMGGISYLRSQKGLFTGNVWHGALAGPIAKDLYLGAMGKYVQVKGPRNSDAATVDAGLFWQVSDLVSIGAAGYNLVTIANEAVAPMGAGAGIGLGNDRSFQITGDWRADFDRAGKTTNRYAAGVEILLGNLVPIRAGWAKDETLDGDWWSAGAGLVTQGGVALDVGYRQALGEPSARTVAATLKLFLFQ
jgi:hypothetical protein